MKYDDFFYKYAIARVKELCYQLAVNEYTTDVERQADEKSLKRWRVLLRDFEALGAS